LDRGDSEAERSHADHGKVDTLGGTPRSGVRMVSEPPMSLDFDERLLNEAELRAHLQEIQAVGADFLVTLKRSPRAKARECTLEDVVLPLVSHEVFGAQVEFSGGGHRWLDTLISTRSGVRLVRLQLTA
jgi:hypothetical protein